MASSPVAQVATTSLDQQGISTVTATRSLDNTRLGSMYDNTTLAAGAPVHIHQIGSAQFLVTLARRWHSATPSTSQAGHYSAYTESQQPSWALVGPSGARTLIDSTPLIPLRTPVDSAQLVDGTSRAPDYVFLLHSATAGDQTSGLIQHFRVATAGRIVATGGEEVIPNLADQGVIFDRGLRLFGQYVTVFGADDDGNIFQARKLWNALGVDRVSSAQRGDSQLLWEFSTGTGWDIDPANAGPEVGLNSVGPVSYALWRKSHYIAVVQAQSDDRVAQIYTQTPARPWTKVGSPIPLGSVSDGSYLGGTAQLQPELLATQALIDSPAHATAIPYVVTTKTSAGDEDALQVTWDLLQIPR